MVSLKQFSHTFYSRLNVIYLRKYFAKLDRKKSIMQDKEPSVSPGLSRAMKTHTLSGELKLFLKSRNIGKNFLFFSFFNFVREKTNSSNKHA